MLNPVASTSEVMMDWIERWFGASPDGGDGSLELAFAVVLLVVGIGLAMAAVARSHRLRRTVTGSVRRTPA